MSLQAIRRAIDSLRTPNDPTQRLEPIPGLSVPIVQHLVHLDVKAQVAFGDAAYHYAIYYVAAVEFRTGPAAQLLHNAKTTVSTSRCTFEQLRPGEGG